MATLQNITESPREEQGVRSFRAEEAITAGHAVMKGTADDQVQLPTGATVSPYGIALEDATEGQNIPVATAGRVRAYAGAAVAAGAKVYIHGADGELDDAAQAGGCLGDSMTAATAAGEVIVVDMAKFGAGPFA